MHRFSSQIQHLRELEAISLVQQIERPTIALEPNSQIVSTACVQQGRGDPPILLLHGFDSSLLEFRCLLPRLAKKSQTWAVDLFGFGFTERVTGVPVNPASIRQHLHQMWQTLIHQPVMVVGASLGGAVAIDFALTYPECVSQLVLIDSVGFSGSFAIGQWLFSPLDTIAAEWLRWRKWAALTAAEATPSPDHQMVDAIRCSLLHHEMPGWSGAIISFTKSGGYSGLNARINQIRHPTLILWGEADDVLGTQDAEKFRCAIANSQLVWIQHCGHNPHLEQPDVTAKHILEFIT